MTQTRDPQGNGDMSSTEKHNADSSCPPANVWEHISAGTISEDAAMPYLRHAAGCPGCSDLLAHALAPDESDATPEEEAFLSQLSTSTASGQQHLAARMFATAGTSTLVSARPPRKIFSWPVLTLAAAAVTAIAAFIAVQRLGQPPEQRLLAQAYDHNRLTELRIPGASAVDLHSPTRGSNNAVTSSELLKAKLDAQQRFEKTPNDPALRQTLGEIAIVEHDGEAARRDFEMAEALNSKLPRLKFDLASAYFELAETSQHPLDYARAIDLFGQYLQDVHQQDSVALFDRGLCWERQSVNTEAIKDFEAALALEKDAGWRTEIQRHIDKLKAQSALDNASPAPLTPASFLALKTESPGDYELYLDAAGREWLPHRNDDPQTQQALQQLAAMAAQHQDLWLHDLLAAPTSAPADAALSQALQASLRGDADTANTASSSAVKLYQQANSQPGALRARAEHIYSLQRMGRTKDCLSEAEPLSADRGLLRYAWMHSYLELEISTCHTSQGENSSGVRFIKDAENITKEANLPIIGLRASGFLSSALYAQGDFEQAWQAASSGLKDSRGVRGTAMRSYQFLDTLERVASGLSLNWTQAGFADAASQAALRTGNLQIGAYALEGNGSKQLAIGAIAPARESFDAADRMLTQLGNGKMAQLYRADWQKDRATLEAQVHGLTTALATMSAGQSQFENFNQLLTKANFYTEYADLLRKAGRHSESVAMAWTAAQTCEKMLEAVQNESQRPEWEDQTNRAYRVLALSLDEAGEPDKALRAWEWYRGATYRAAAKTHVVPASRDISVALTEVPSAPAASLTLVYARLEDRYVAWSIPSNPGEPVRMQTLTASPDTIDNEVLAFHRLCSDPNSSVQDIAVIGRALDHNLIAPFADQVDHAETLQLDLDSSLASIPFAALQHGETSLGLAHPLLYLQAGWTFAPANSNVLARTDSDRLPNQPSLLIIRETPPPNAPRIPDEYDESSDIGRRFPQARIQSAVLERAGQSLTFSGTPALHSVVPAADVIHYTGHGLDEGSQTPAPSVSSFTVTRGSILRCRLAVLAACQTLDQRENVTDNVPSFARILLQAGASHVLATQWDVDSRMTHKLMVRFYAELANHQTFSEALRRAQQSVQSDPAAVHPYYWSAFQLVGQPKSK